MEPLSRKPMSEAQLLLVEDDSTNRFFLCELLTTMGLPEPATAGNGQEALTRIGQGHPDLVFMDCQMPVMDGFEATRHLRALEGGQGPRLPVIALTAFAMEEDRQACFAAGMDDFLTKPVQESELRLALQQWLGRRGFYFEDAPTASCPPSVDRPPFEELCQMLGRDGVTTLIHTFLEGLPAKIHGLHQAEATQQWEDLVRIAHTLKGNCGILKVSDLGQVCQEMVRLGRTDNPRQAAALLPALVVLAQRLATTMEHELARLSSCR